MRSKTALLSALALVGLIAAPAIARTLADVTLRIHQGCHYDTRLFGARALELSLHTERSLAFDVMFPASDAYTTQNPANQDAWNKVMGISTARIHHNSIRLGWRWLPNENKMELGFYGYLKGQRIMEPLVKVAPGAWTPVEIRMSGPRGLSVEAGGVKYERNEALGFSALFPTPTWILETAYFGGQETAPHDLAIQVRNIVVN